MDNSIDSIDFDFLNNSGLTDEEKCSVLNEEVEEEHYVTSQIKWKEIGAQENNLNKEIPSLASCTLVKFPKREICLFGGISSNSKEATNELWLFKIDQCKWEKITFNEKRDFLLIKKNAAYGTFHANKIMNLKPSLRCVEPCGRCGHVAVTLNSTDMLVFGGNDIKNQRLLNDIWIFKNENVKTWKLIVPTGNLPLPRWYTTCVHYQGKFFLFGGETYNFSLLNDMCIFAYDKQKWLEMRTLYPTPSPRMLHSATVVNDKMYVIGGLGRKNNEETCNIWCFDLALFKWIKINPRNEGPFTVEEISEVSEDMMEKRSKKVTLPLNMVGKIQIPIVEEKIKEMNVNIITERKEGKIKTKVKRPIYGHSAFALGNKIVIFGGKQNSKLLNDVWLYNTKNNKWEKPKWGNDNKPSKRWKHITTSELEINEFSKDDGKLSVRETLESQRVERVVSFYTYGGNTEILDEEDTNIFSLSMKISQTRNY